MSLVLPPPAAPAAHAAPRQQQRAYRLWQAGQGHAQGERWSAAAQAYVDAHELSSDAPYGLAAAHALIKADRADQALQRARRLCQRHPDSVAAYTLQAHALLALNRHAEAVQMLQAMPAQLPRDLDHWMSLALALQRLGRHADALPVLFQALALKMDHAYLHFQLGMSFKDLGLKAEAAECVRTAVQLGVGSSDLAARGQLWFLEREACRWPQAQAEAHALSARWQALPDAAPMEASAFSHAVLEDDPAAVLVAARHQALHVQRGVKPLGRRAARAHTGRLRLGYLSADFHTHATSQLLVQMLEQHDRQDFEVSLFSSGPDDASSLRSRMQAASEHFVDLRGLPYDAMAQRIRQARIDILIDLKGITYDNLLPVLAQRPAPLQASWLGFPGTTGAPYIDYLIGDPIVTPLDQAAHYAECIAQLPHCYQPNDRWRARPEADARARWGVRQDALLLCGFHQSYKISESVFETWCQLLHQLPNSVLWLLHWNQNVQAALCSAASARGIGPERLLFAPVVPLERHLARLACADLFLDTWPCNAHTTAGEALWMGVPVVTLQGRTFAQRVAASLLHAVGLPQLVCHDVAGYVELIAELAQDAPRRHALKQQLEQQRLNCHLFDSAARAREMENLLQRMWQRATAGLAPAALQAQP